LSFLAHGDFEAEVKGLDQFPRANWPPVAVTHIAFQTMIGIGTLLSALGAWSLFALWKKPAWLRSRKILRLFAVCAPLGFVAIEAGWTVTEVGRQPWIIYGTMKTKDAVTPMPGLIYPMMLFTVVYLMLAFIVIWLMGGNSVMLVEAIAFFLAVSILLYCLLGGADFGAGMLEAFAGTERREEQRKIIAHAIGPVWEANHVWLILAVVIFFTGFPKAYSVLSITFHIPLTLMLLGIVLRGCAFTFRHYDAVRDDSQRYYSAIFVVSSFLTPLMLGVVAGGMLLGGSSQIEESFYGAFVRPWVNFFCFSVGVFACVLFGFLAAVYLIGETREAGIRRIFVHRAMILNALAILVGIAVFIAAELDGLPLARLFAGKILSLGSIVGATLILAPLWIAVRQNRVQMARIFVAVQVALVLVGWFRLQFPMILNAQNKPLTIDTAAAPEPTLRYLLYALIAGSVIIFSALIYLLKIFKLSGANEISQHSALPRA
jgi:cytochrome d ubiquinol oxidase subunit II